MPSQGMTPKFFFNLLFTKEKFTIFLTKLSPMSFVAAVMAKKANAG